MIYFFKQKINNMFNWDGSQIFLENMILEEGIYNKTIYWRIHYIYEKEQKEEICEVKKSSNKSIPCLIDEIKPIFDLKKIGTHWTKYKGKYLILLKVDLDENRSIKYHLSLDLYKYNQKIEKEIQKIFAFRDMLGMSRSYEKSIILKDINSKKLKYMVPVSFYEPNMTPSNDGKIIPNSVLEKWFHDTTIDDVIKKMLKIDKPEDIGSGLLKLRQNLENIVERCDRDSIMFVDEILTKIGSKLQFIL